VTLPLSYSRLRLAPQRRRVARLRRASPPFPCPRASLFPSLSKQPLQLGPPFDSPSLSVTFDCSRSLRAFDSACHERGRKAESNGGEGRIRTFEALGRQIYSLLRLTASLPRRTNHPINIPAPRPTLPQRLPRSSSLGACPDPLRAWNNCGSLRPVGRARNLELAKGFEPPTG
jgi:hypothetical protein